MLLYCLFSCKQFLLHELDCVFNAGNSIILCDFRVTMRRALLFRSLLFVFKVVLLTNEVIKPSAMSILPITSLVTATWLLIFQHFYCPFDVALLLGPFELLDEILCLFNVSLRLYQLIEVFLIL